MKSVLSISLLGLLLTLFGCASDAPISKTQCDIGDWQTIGHRDGALGYRSSRLLALQEACIEHGVRPDRESYMLGWREGVREYCVASHAYSIGERGFKHNNICPEDLRAEFVHAYQQGRALHIARARVSELESTIHRSTLRLEQVRKSLISTAAAQLNPLLTPSRRAELVAELQGLNDERNRLIADIPRLREELIEQQSALDELNRSMAAVDFD